MTGSTYLAECGEPVLAGSHYSVTATADDGYRFFPGTGRATGWQSKVFEGDLAAQAHLLWPSGHGSG